MMKPRTGLRFRVETGVHPEVRRACLEFGRWLRDEYEFPVRVNVYFKKSAVIKNRYTKELVSATFFAPFDKDVEPHIRISTGDYQELMSELGKDNALASILGSIAHELGHYYQWIDDLELDEDEAENNREELLYLYSQTRDHP